MTTTLAAAESDQATVTGIEPTPERPDPETVRLAFARAWGDMGTAWGVQPSVALVHGYLMAHTEVLTERELREALDLSHRATQHRARGDRGLGAHRARPGRAAGRPEGDGPQRHGESSATGGSGSSAWRKQRKAREADTPWYPASKRVWHWPRRAVVASPTDIEALRLRDWMTELLGFLRLFERAVGVLARAEFDRDRTRLRRARAGTPDESLDRLLRLL